MNRLKYLQVIKRLRVKMIKTIPQKNSYSLFEVATFLSISKSTVRRKCLKFGIIIEKSRISEIDFIRLRTNTIPSIYILPSEMTNAELEIALHQLIKKYC